MSFEQTPAACSIQPPARPSRMRTYEPNASNTERSNLKALQSTVSWGCFLLAKCHVIWLGNFL